MDIETNLPSQLENACCFLEHWHTEHTDDIITRLGSENADILIVSDPSWRDRLKTFVAAAFSTEDPRVTGLKQFQRQIGEVIEALETTNSPGKDRIIGMMRGAIATLLEQLEAYPTDPAPPASGGVQ